MCAMAPRFPVTGVRGPALALATESTLEGMEFVEVAILHVLHGLQGSSC
jgi:hypothetical protein